MRSRAFHAQKVASLKPTQPVMYREITAVEVPVTANVQRMSRSWSEDTFHFCCSLFNMLQREEKNRFILFYNLLFILKLKTLAISCHCKIQQFLNR